MEVEEKIYIPNPPGYNCFACGTENPIGLKLQFYCSGKHVCTEITLGENHVGWSNISHGGIISTILDEVMSWTILYFKKVFFLTRKMEVKYIKPVLVGTPLVARGKIIDMSESSRRIRVRAEIRDNHDTLLAKSAGEFIAIEKDDLPPVFDESKKEIFSFLGGMTSK